MSHPTWVRGLKQDSVAALNKTQGVAPYVGAWIETIIDINPQVNQNVAPYVGAWIETKYIKAPVKETHVAPYVGAWIETVSVNS